MCKGLSVSRTHKMFCVHHKTWQRICSLKCDRFIFRFESCRDLVFLFLSGFMDFYSNQPEPHINTLTRMTCSISLRSLPAVLLIVSYFLPSFKWLRFEPYLQDIQAIYCAKELWSGSWSKQGTVCALMMVASCVSWGLVKFVFELSFW